MNREILFRGKRLDTGEWVEGAYLLLNGDDHRIATSCIDGDDKNLLTVCAYPVDPKTIGQYTGLEDKNGVKIFEGDIVIANQEREQDRVVITFDNSAFTAHPVTGKILEKTLWEYWWNDWDIEVIGNRYDNPELLHEEVTP